jgi:hypothetical protein
MSNEQVITVSYKALKDNFPEYKQIKLPKKWYYNGFEGAMKTQPKWITNNAYFYGLKQDTEKAVIKIDQLFKLYVKNGFVSKYIIHINK